MRAFESLKASSFRDWIFIVVDNASSDDSRVKLLEHLPEADVILHSHNAGFAGGCNIGITRALSRGHDYVFLLNNDATVISQCLSELVIASLGLQDRAILGAAVKFADIDRYQFVGSDTEPLEGLPKWRNPTDVRLDEGLIQSDFIFGAALFIPVSILRTVGLMDERFFLNYEETDLCFRARRAGLDCYVVPSAVVLHQSGASLGDYDSPLQTYFLARNELLFAEKHSKLQQRVRLFMRRSRMYLSRVKRSITSNTPMGLDGLSMGLAIRDYMFRRFGDCPPTIRSYARRYQKDQMG